jgi:hypothetical protein
MERVDGEFEATGALRQLNETARATTVNASFNLSDRKSKKVSPTFNKLVRMKALAGL